MLHTMWALLSTKCLGLKVSLRSRRRVPFLVKWFQIQTADFPCPMLVHVGPNEDESEEKIRLEHPITCQEH